MKFVTFDRPKGASEEKGGKVKEVLNTEENLLQYACQETERLRKGGQCPREGRVVP